ncbi:MAG TPA: 16S rRNA (cytosine(1402)-N(4))-methyltransferase RsmH [Acholeplasmataceae bacterium]|nr:16S rRNA (cytosine(1402)-N(4))-methyltransferase RsmH [Acholeplasmataceae bacterium]
MKDYEHIPVMLEEVIAGLNIKAGGIYVDCTMGGAGHAAEILKRLSTGYLYCFEQDDYAITRGSEVLSSISDRFKIISDNFVNLKARLQALNVNAVDGILYDLGVSSFQLDIGERGFSYNQDARLDMRMDTSSNLTAYEIVNTYSYEELKRIFYTYGEEKFSPRIASKIIESRQIKPITTTLELSEIIKEAIPAFARRKGGHPAKKVFQALRIAVNDELNVFEKSLTDALSLLKEGGRIAVITFHSLEDRICKRLFKSKTEIITPRGLPIKASELKPEYRLINRKVITPSEEEIKRNHRAHSAKLRIIERIKEENNE